MKHLYKSIIFSLAAFLLLANPKVFGQTWTNYSSIDLSKIAIDAEGDKWVGSYSSGLYKFDGATWTNYRDSKYASGGFYSINSIAIDAEGNKWLGNTMGVVKYDGTNWTQYTLKPTPQYALTVTSIAIDAQGNKWFGTNNGGVYKFDGTTWTVFVFDGTNWINNILEPNENNIIRDTLINTVVPSNVENNHITSIAIDAQGNKWFGTYSGVSKFNGSAWTNFHFNNGLGVSAIAVDAQNNIWAGSQGIIYKLNGNGWDVYDMGWKLDNKVVSSIISDAQGNTWFGSNGKGVIKYDGNEFLTADNKEYVNSMAIDAQGKKWAVTRGSGLSQFDQSTWSQFTWTNYPLGLVNQSVRTIAIDLEDNKWIGTDYGISKFDGNAWTSYTSGSGGFGLLDQTITTIVIDKAGGDKWVGTKNNGISVYNGNMWLNYTIRDGELVSNNINAIAIDAQKYKWIGTDLGVSKFNDQTRTSTNYTQANGLVNNYVYSIAIDAKGNKWFATAGGVSKFDGKTWTNYTTTNGLVDNKVLSIAIDKEGNKWFGTKNGISKFNDLTWTNYTESNSTPIGAVNTIIIDKEGNKWFGTGQGGAYKFDGNTWTNFNSEESPLGNVTAIAIDAQGNRWFGVSNIGLSKLSAIPTVKSPGNNVSNVNPAILTIISNTAPEAASYTIEVNTAPDFSGTSIIKSSSSPSIKFFGELDYNKTYYTRVKTNLSYEWGATKKFTTQATSYFNYVISPANNASNVNTTSLTIKANAIAGASSYTIEVNTTSDFSEPSIIKTGSTPNINFFGELAYGTTYYTRVKTNLSEDWGTTKQFTTATPEYFSYMTSPGNNVLNINPATVTIKSTTITRAATYYIEANTSLDFTGTSIIKTGSTPTLDFSGSLAYGTTYYTRVKTDLSEEWGVTKQFTTGSVDYFSYVSSPANNATNQNPANISIRSNIINGATSYIIEVNTSPDFSGTSIIKTGTTPTINFSGTLAYETTYYTRVKTNLSEAWGATKQFSTGAVTYFSYITSPAYGETNVNPATITIKANTITGATTYFIEVNTSEDFRGTSIIRSNSTSSIKFGGTLASGTTYYTRVKTNLSGDVWGPVRQFTTAPKSSARFSFDDLGLNTPSQEAYPNPFTKDFHVNFTAQSTGQNRVEVYNMQGILVKVLYDGFLNEGSQINFEVNGEDLNEDIYLLKFTNQKEVKNIKLLRVK